MAAWVRIIDSPLGGIILCANDLGLESLNLAEDEEISLTKRRLIFQKTIPMVARIHLDEAENWLDAFFANPSELPSGPELSFPSEDGFQAEVWRLLAASEAGETFTYGELAEGIGKPGASRAVGTAMAKNPIPLIVPCHRVLPKGGGLGNYSARGGTKTKQWLLDHETFSP